MTRSSKQLKPPLQVFRGEKIQASYHDEISIYSGNPLIEALPTILTEDEVIEKLQFYPEFSESERQLPAHLRLHLIQNVLQFFTPLPPHIELEQRFSRMIRAGYIARNPVQLGFWKDVRSRCEILRSTKLNSRNLRSTATGFTILGISGIGKSTAVQEILSLYPQVIHHNRYRDSLHSPNTQLVWLKLECPSDGSVKGLCLNFFQAVDDILATPYYEIYGGSGHRTVNEMMPYVALVASNVHLGVLVIDEIQCLTKLNVGGYEKILDFFVQLINTIGLPVVLVGTYKAWSILGSEFRSIRRGTGQGDFIWDRMKEDEDWQLFVESLWQYQYVQKPCELTPQMSHSLYYECQGITDFAVKVFMLAQARAITTLKEKITQAIIKSVASDCLRTAKEVLDAFKQGNLKQLQSCEDVHPIDIEPFIQEELQQLRVEDSCTQRSKNFSASMNISLSQDKQAERQEHNCDFSEKSAATKQKNVDNSLEIKTLENSHTSPKNVELSGGLLEIVANGKQCGICAYEALQEAGYICAVASDFLEDVVK
ncbi:Tn7-like transposition protein C [Tolypothrix sp. NIES-4075]|uniref:ATP-binding protein n=1 Tax=Tolypothrix sp. NIES-4075 TaxID=2005459 RepID=UPI000B5CB22D|nr:ATP-binding protein [Tolypothrix sp. NIES-4075]GAX45295.1 Tn7-like transposition protein C [Tolypothrix sp. NIES-4075]